ncbi:hypothetical protein [Mesorhizobium sp. B261B1A]|uniref:hypothetical protein n=1 Tax=Mesorhizobium sp. B261B1A TaxID=2876671 RepID=UPI001CD14576|nr:hypothetical protein [Mesorhizobium sp. B261B1A]MCA0058054.1 hypothetical protein [Mesorhizobium sp. B261B1A]
MGQLVPPRFRRDPLEISDFPMAQLRAQAWQKNHIERKLASRVGEPAADEYLGAGAEDEV